MVRTCYVFPKRTYILHIIVWYLVIINSYPTTSPIRPTLSLFYLYFIFILSLFYLYFYFEIINFPDLSSNIPTSPSYGIYISQLIQNSRTCSSYSDLVKRHQCLSRKLMNQGYVKERLVLFLKKSSSEGTKTLLINIPY